MARDSTGGQQAVHVLGASHQRGEGSQLLRQGQQDLMFIIDGVCEEGQKLAAGPFYPKGQNDGGQLLDAVETKLNILVAERVSEHRHGVKRVVAVGCRHLGRREKAGRRGWGHRATLQGLLHPHWWLCPGQARVSLARTNQAPPTLICLRRREQLLLS